MTDSKPQRIGALPGGSQFPPSGGVSWSEYLSDDPWLMAAIRSGRRVVPLVPFDEWPQEIIDRALELMSMAMAEAGHPVESWWSETREQWLVPVGTPEPLLDRARLLVFPHLGIEFEVLTDA